MFSRSHSLQPLERQRNPSMARISRTRQASRHQDQRRVRRNFSHLDLLGKKLTSACRFLVESRLKNLIGDNYYKMRDNSYSAWDESMLKSYLNKNKIQYEKDAKKSDLIDLVKDSCKFRESPFLVLDFIADYNRFRLRRFFLPLEHVVGFGTSSLGRQGKGCRQRQSCRNEATRTREPRRCQLQQSYRHNLFGLEREQYEGLVDQERNHQI